MNSTQLPPSLTQARDSIVAEMEELGALTVAFSGGVDSSLVAALAYRALGSEAVAVTVVSETLKHSERLEAREVAREIGIEHRETELSELDDDDFRANTAARCYFCQSMRFDQLLRLSEHLGVSVVASGTNASDLGEHRPGLQAMAERQVYQPLLQHGVDKDGVRLLSRALGLSVWNKPAQACLSSRIPHGLEVTDRRLRRIEEAEAVLANHGFQQLRVRDLDGRARIEVGQDELPRLGDQGRLEEITQALLRLDFAAVEVDPEGYRAGKLSPGPKAANSSERVR